MTAIWNTLDVTTILPAFKILDDGDVCGSLHPLDCLCHGDKVNVTFLQDFCDPFDESPSEFVTFLKPRGVEIEAEGSPIAVVMTIEIVVQEIVELFRLVDVATRIHHGAAW